MKAKVLTVGDDVVIVDGLTSLLLLEDIESEGACHRMSARAMISGTFCPVIVADVGPPAFEHLQARKKTQIATSFRGTC